MKICFGFRDHWTCSFLIESPQRGKISSHWYEEDGVFRWVPLVFESRAPLFD